MGTLVGRGIQRLPLCETSIYISGSKTFSWGWIPFHCFSTSFTEGLVSFLPNKVKGSIVCWHNNFVMIYF